MILNNHGINVPYHGKSDSNHGKIEPFHGKSDSNHGITHVHYEVSVSDGQIKAIQHKLNRFYFFLSCFIPERMRAANCFLFEK